MAKSRKATWLEKEMVYDAIRNSREPLDINLETCTFKRSGAGNILCLQNGQQVFYVDKKGQLVLPEKKKTAAEKREIKKEKEEARKIQKEKKEAKKEKEEQQKQHWMEVIEKENEKLENSVLGFDIFPVFDRKTDGSIRMSIVIQPKFSNIGAISPLQIPAQKWTDDLIHTKILWATQAYYDVFLNNENERSIRNAVIKYIEGNAGLALDSSLTDLVMYSEFFKQVKLIQRNSLLHKSKLTLSGVKLQPNGLVRFNVSGVTFISDVDGSNLVCKKESTLENIVTFANAHKNVIKTCLYLASEINKRSGLGFSVNLSFTIDVQNRALDAVMLFGDGSAAAKMSFSELELTADKVKAWAYALTRLWGSRNVFLRTLAVLLAITLTATGAYDLLTIYNADKRALKIDMGSGLTEWLKENVKENDLVLTGEESMSEITLSGIMLYNGWPYYAWSAGYDTDTRAANAVEIYSSKDKEKVKKLVKKEGIDYIIYKDGMTYEEHECSDEVIKKIYKCVFEEGKTRVYKVA